ncbi:Uncharacterised protein r2_g3549 [Pycnogonum litorale]
MKDTTGIVVSTADTPRSYEIQTAGGSVRRNRAHLVPDLGSPGSSPRVTSPSVPKPTEESSTSTTVHTRSGRAVIPPRRLDL